ncbi:hypothetical protein [Deinococcus ficus]|uniref:Uncharacterized protein n=1 Tax=Deinococcus ficus TaxID=317577 RepID=A0A221T2P3_9DEIO|nr:hypothetical protein [Deinococcus ficus]ASN83163.1 hypothetical protein DFI_18355 [Deinococcus ficus]
MSPTRRVNPELLTPLPLITDQPVDGRVYRLPGLNAALAMKGNIGRLITMGATWSDRYHTVFNVRRKLNDLEIEIQGQWVTISEGRVQIAIQSLHALRLRAPELPGDLPAAPFLTPLFHEDPRDGLGWWASNVTTHQATNGDITVVTCDVVFTRGDEGFSAKSTLVMTPEPPYHIYTYTTPSALGQQVLPGIIDSLNAQND